MNETEQAPVAADREMNPQQLQSDINTIKGVLEEGDRSRDIHRTIIAAGNLVEGILTLIAIPFLMLAVGIVGVSTPETQAGEPSPTLIVGSAVSVVIIILLALSIPFLLAGWGLFANKSWGKAAAIVAAVLNILNIPLGTALAIYTFWALGQGKLDRLPSSGS